jgi:hypothetical protein
MTGKPDGVIVAVRYSGGQIEFVRAFERRGPTYSDWVLLPRQELIQRLKAGRKFYTGRRREYLAGSFDVDRALRLQQQNGREVIATRADAASDQLEGVPIF